MNADETLYEGEKPYVFISYSHKDRERVFPVLDAMRERGYRFRYDADIQAGRQWTDELAASIANCAAFVPFASDSYGASEYCMQEIRYAKSKKATISPVFLTDTRGLSDNLRYQLENLHGFSLKSASPGDFVAWMEKQTIFRPCRDADADTAAASAELVTNERPAEASPSFVGRVDIMRDIETAFRDGATVVNLYGMGGIGKSEICRKLFHDRADALSRYVGWLTWRDTLQNTLYAQFRDIREDNAERYLNLAREFARRKGRGLLIFLDNADDMTPQQAAELTRLGCRFLVTSRRKQERFYGVPAGTLTPEECRILYRRALRRDETLSDASPDKTLDEIIRLAARHTLTVELLAKTQRAAGMDAQELLDRLTESGFDLTGVDEEIVYEHRPELGGDGDGNRTFLEHMTVVFDLSKLRETQKKTFPQKILGFFRKRDKVSDTLWVLQGMSLLSPNTPISVNTVQEWLELPDLNGLNTAVDTGWLNESIEPDGVRFISIHPIIAAVVQYVSPPTPDYADAVAGHLYKAMELTEIYTTTLPILKHAEALRRAAWSINLQMENYTRMLVHAGSLNDSQGEYASALECYQEALAIQESVFGIAHPYTAAIYNCIGLVYRKQGDYASAMKWHQVALSILEILCGKVHPETASTYANIGLVYDAQGDYDSALEWHQKALCIYEARLGKNSPITASVYSNIGAVYSMQGDYASALECYQEALRILESVYGKNHPSTSIAVVYYNIGWVYDKQGDFREAVAWMEKALAILMKVLGSEHPNTKNMQKRLDDARERLTEKETL